MVMQVVGTDVDPDTGVVTIECEGDPFRYAVTWTETPDEGPVLTSLRIVAPEGQVVTPKVVRRVALWRLALCARAATEDPNWLERYSGPPTPAPVTAEDVAAVDPGDARAALCGLSVRQIEVLRAASVAVRGDGRGFPGFVRPQDVGRGVSQVLATLFRRGLLDRAPVGLNSTYRVSALGLAVLGVVG